MILDHYITGLTPDKGMITYATKGFYELLTEHETAELLIDLEAKNRMVREEHIYPHEGEDTLILAYSVPTQDNLGRDGNWTHLIATPISQYIFHTKPSVQLDKYFIKKPEDNQTVLAPTTVK